MVNSESLESDGDGRKTKDVFTQQRKDSTNVVTATTGPTVQQTNIATCAVSPRDADFSSTRTADASPLLSQAIEPTATKTEYNSTISSALQQQQQQQQQYDDTSMSNIKELSFTSTCDRGAMFVDVDTYDNKTSLYCSLPLNKVQDVLSTNKGEDDIKKTPITTNTTTITTTVTTITTTAAATTATAATATATAATSSSSNCNNKLIKTKLLCLYCERTFVTPNLKLKHVDRCHSIKQERRCSSRFHNQQSTTACSFCNTLNNTDHSLNDLFQHLVNNHPAKYFGCIPCEERFPNLTLLNEHNLLLHGLNEVTKKKDDKTRFKNNNNHNNNNSNGNNNRSKNNKDEHDQIQQNVDNNNSSSSGSSSSKRVQNKRIQNKRAGVKSVKLGVRRTTRLQTKILEMSSKNIKKRSKNNKLKNEQSASSSSTTTTISTAKRDERPQPRPTFNFSFDNLFTTYKKITDHSIDNLRISTLTFDDVFDKAFFNKIKCNIQENLLNHLDGKLFKNEESESRISNFEKTNLPLEFQPNNLDNYGCELSLNAATPIPSTSTMTTQLGDDIESQIEYGSKASKKKNVIKKDEVHYKYFTRRKYQATLLENKENRDLSKLDMWTQLVIKTRQQKIIHATKTEKEILEYTKGDEYKSKIQREELNRILDKRGPFEDLKIEASKMAANNTNCDVEIFTEVRDVLNDLIENVLLINDTIPIIKIEPSECMRTILEGDGDDDEMPNFLNLRKKTSICNEQIIDQSDRITLICSSQETENFEVKNSIPRKHDELVELTGEWARSRIYICAACGSKVNSAKSLVDHKNVFHQYVWCQHYEFVGNQSELYRHLSIPGLGKVGIVEERPNVKSWKRSNARQCSKCNKQCNSLGELHRHILECGEDWSWMLARKKCKYRPFGSRRKRRGLVKRIIQKDNTKPEMQEKKKYIKKIDGPRTKPSDADTIQRMLANLPPKRVTRKLICLKDGYQRNSARQKANVKKVAKNAKNTSKRNKLKNCTNANIMNNQNVNKMSLRQRNKAALAESTINEEDKVKRKNGQMLRKSFRNNMNKVLSSKILDTNCRLKTKRKLKNFIKAAHTKRTDKKHNNKNKFNNLNLVDDGSNKKNINNSDVTIIIESEYEDDINNDIKDDITSKPYKRKQEQDDDNGQSNNRHCTSTENTKKNVVSRLKRKVSLENKCTELMKSQIEIENNGSKTNSRQKEKSKNINKSNNRNNEQIDEQPLIIKSIKRTFSLRGRRKKQPERTSDIQTANVTIVVDDNKLKLAEDCGEGAVKESASTSKSNEVIKSIVEPNEIKPIENVEKLKEIDRSEEVADDVKQNDKPNRIIDTNVSQQSSRRDEFKESSADGKNLSNLKRKSKNNSFRNVIKKTKLIENDDDLQMKCEKNDNEKKTFLCTTGDVIIEESKLNANESNEIYEKLSSISGLTKDQENLIFSVIKNTKDFDKIKNMTTNETLLKDLNQYYPFTYSCLFKDDVEKSKLNLNNKTFHDNKETDEIKELNIEKHNEEERKHLDEVSSITEINNKPNVNDDNTVKSEQQRITKKNAKKGRGLNDCIAMLTSKLQQNCKQQDDENNEPNKEEIERDVKSNNLQEELPNVDCSKLKINPDDRNRISQNRNLNNDQKILNFDDKNLRLDEEILLNRRQSNKNITKSSDPNHLELIVKNAIKKAAAEAMKKIDIVKDKKMVENPEMMMNGIEEVNKTLCNVPIKRTEPIKETPKKHFEILRAPEFIAVKRATEIAMKIPEIITRKLPEQSHEIHQIESKEIMLNTSKMTKDHVETIKIPEIKQLPENVSRAINHEYAESNAKMQNPSLKCNTKNSDVKSLKNAERGSLKRTNLDNGNDLICDNGKVYKNVAADLKFVTKHAECTRPNIDFTQRNREVITFQEEARNSFDVKNLLNLHDDDDDDDDDDESESDDDDNRNKTENENYFVKNTILNKNHSLFNKQLFFKEQQLQFNANQLYRLPFVHEMPTFGDIARISSIHEMLPPILKIPEITPKKFHFQTNIEHQMDKEYNDAKKRFENDKSMLFIGKKLLDTHEERINKFAENLKEALIVNSKENATEVDKEDTDTCITSVRTNSTKDDVKDANVLIGRDAIVQETKVPETNVTKSLETTETVIIVQPATEKSPKRAKKSSTKTNPLETFTNYNVANILSNNITKEIVTLKEQTERDDDAIQVNQLESIVIDDCQVAPEINHDDSNEVAKENIEIQTNCIDNNFKNNSVIEDVMKPLENVNKGDDVNKCIKLIIKKKISQNENKNWKRKPKQKQKFKQKQKIVTNRKRNVKNDKISEGSELEAIPLIDTAIVETSSIVENLNGKCDERKIGQKRKEKSNSFNTDLPYLETNLDTVIDDDDDEERTQEFDDKLDMNLSNNDSGVFVDDKLTDVQCENPPKLTTKKKCKDRKIDFSPMQEQLEPEVLEDKPIDKKKHGSQLQKTISSDSEDEIPLAFIMKDSKHQEKTEPIKKRRGRKKKQTVEVAQAPIIKTIQSQSAVISNLDLIFDELKNKVAVDVIKPAKLPESQSITSNAGKTPPTEESDYFEPLADINTLDSYSSSEDDNVEFVKEPVSTEPCGDLKICIKLKESVKRRGRNRRKFEFNTSIRNDYDSKQNDEDSKEEINIDAEILETENILNNMSNSSDNIRDKIAIDAVENIYNNLTENEPRNEFLEDDETELKLTADGNNEETPGKANNLEDSGFKESEQRQLLSPSGDLLIDETTTDLKRQNVESFTVDNAEDIVTKNVNHLSKSDDVVDIKKDSSMKRSTQIGIINEEDNGNNYQQSCLEKTKKIDGTSKTRKHHVKKKIVNKEDILTEDTYCDICNKTFVRAENLIKHKRTFSHIAKLSEIEAKEEAERRRKLQESEMLLNERMQDEEKVDEDAEILTQQNEKSTENKIDETEKALLPDKEEEETINNKNTDFKSIIDTESDFNINNDFNRKTSSIKENSFINEENSVDKEKESSTLIVEDKEELMKEDEKLTSVENVLTSTEKGDINISSILQKPNEMLILSPKNILVPPALTSNDTLKLADIINDVLNKPVNNNESETILKPNNYNDTVDIPPAKRYKSLGERKSFEAESANLSYSEIIAQKQISLLENMIEENNVGYNDDYDDASNVSIRSETPVVNKEREEEELIVKTTPEEAFMKPIVQYEEISEDSLHLRTTTNLEEQTTRKVLNRDEELFLECCSLLKSSSEVSNYSKKSTRTIPPVFDNFKPIDEPEWLERKSVKPDYEDDCNDIYSDNNTTDRNDYSNSYTSNDWNNKNSSSAQIFEDISLDDDDDGAHKISNNKDDDVYVNNFKVAFDQINDDNKKVIIDEENVIEDKSKNDDKEKTKLVERFGGLMAKAFKNKFQKKTKKHKQDVVQKPITDYLEKDNGSESCDDLSMDNKKMLTKGAMKIFEGLKVSIPTDELDMTELLNSSPSTKSLTNNVINSSSSTSNSCCTKKTDSKSKTHINKFGNKLGLKVTKKKHLQHGVRRSPKANKNCDKILDIYDFEETQDNTDVFTNNITDLKTFRSQTKGNEIPTKELPETQQQEQPSFTYEVESLSSFSTESSDTLKKSKAKNITKKKCMIMGRIFKNAFKSKVDDPVVEDIPIVDNSKLVEKYATNCANPTTTTVTIKNVVDEEKPTKISNDEMDKLFDRLLQDTPTAIAQQNPLVQTQHQQNDLKKHVKLAKKSGKGRKRRNDDTSDDEYNINKGPRKRNMKKNNKLDVGINLEQELKECIGVASRKSQRKCTSGKQNVLVEFWSSDESNFENLLEEIGGVSSPEFQVNQPVRVDNFSVSLKPQSETVKTIDVVVPKLIEDDPLLTNKSECNKKRKVSVPKRKKVTTNNSTSTKPSSSSSSSSPLSSTATTTTTATKPNKQDKQFKKPTTAQDSIMHDESCIVDSLVATRKKRNASDTLYYWSSSSDDELSDMIEVKPIREEDEDDDENRPMQHGWIVGDSPKKLVTMLAQAKGKKTDMDCVKEQSKKRTTI